VGVDDNFFDLGGHSLAATRVLAQVQQLWQLDVPLKDFFKRPTLASLAELVEQRSLAPAAHELARLDPSTLRARLEGLPDEQIDALLVELLGTNAQSPALASGGAGVTAPHHDQALLTQIDELSDESVDALLTELMEATV
jgi:hypothetical protein